MDKDKNDITDGNRSEEAIRESEERLHLLLNSTGEAIYGIDLSGNCTFCNPSCLRLLGYEDESQLLGRHMHDLIHHTRKDGTHYPVEECCIYQAFRDGKGAHVDDEVFWRADSTSFETEYRSFPIIRDGNTVGSVVSFVDITIRKQAEREIVALNESLEERVLERTAEVAKLSHAIEYSSATVVITDTEGNIEYANPRFEQLTGYSIEEAIGKNPSILKSGKTPDEVYEELWSTIKLGYEWKGEFCNRKKNGDLYWESASISPVKDAEGVITNFIAVKDDITERKQVEEALQRSNQLLSTVIESPDNIIIFVLDKSYHYLSFNMAHIKEMKEVYGADIEIGQDILSYIPVEDDRLKAEANYKRVLKGERFVKIEEYGNPDSRFWYELVFNPIYDNLHHVTGFTVFVTDITERRLAEEALSQSERHFRSYFDLGLIGMAITSLEKGWVEFNDTLYKMFGYSREDFARLTWTELTHPEDLESDLAQFNRVLAGEIDGYTIEKRFIRRDGSTLYAVISANAVRKADGMVDYFVALVHDITDRKKMEDVLIQSEKLKSIGTITAGISHEFNNILAIISGKTELLEMIYKDNKDLVDELRIIKQAAHDGAAISSNMLKFTKVHQDTKEFISFDVKDLIKDSIAFTKPRWQNEAQSRGVDYKMSTEGIRKVPPIMCKPAEIREIFINIINNALDAMPGGGAISFDAWAGDDAVYISVADTGEGMPEYVVRNIFDPFFSTKGVEGTGLGMSMVYGIVTRHGGKIEVNSEIGKGTTFTLQFPTTNKEKTLIEISDTEQKTNVKSLRILVVDDEDKIRDILNQFLSRDGHTVKTVDNGADAINMVEGEDFDLVLCDIAMPNVFGYDVVKALNRLKKRPKIGIVSGWKEKLKNIDDKELNVDFYLKKPFTHSELTKHIDKAFVEDSK